MHGVGVCVRVCACVRACVRACVCVVWCVLSHGGNLPDYLHCNGSHAMSE